MRETTGCQVEDPGAVPGASTQENQRSDSGIQPTTEHCSVKTAKRLPAAGDTVEVATGLDFPQDWLLGTVETVAPIKRGRGKARLRLRVPGCEVLVPVRSDDEGVTWQWPVSDSAAEGGSVVAAPAVYPQAKSVMEDAPVPVVPKVEPLPCARLGSEKCARKGCEERASVGSVWCSGHGKAAEAAGDGGSSATCDNLPAVRPTDEEGACTCVDDDDHGARPLEGGCDVHAPVRTCAAQGCVTILGPEIPRDLCAAHAALSTCTFCSSEGRLTFVAREGDLCADCKRRAVSESEQPNDAAEAARMQARFYAEEAYEAMWNALADDSYLDPRTVAACKAAQDALRGIR
jgi:hypothetical protein